MTYQNLNFLGSGNSAGLEEAFPKEIASMDPFAEQRCQALTISKSLPPFRAGPIPETAPVVRNVIVETLIGSDDQVMHSHCRALNSLSNQAT